MKVKMLTALIVSFVLLCPLLGFALAGTATSVSQTWLGVNENDHSGLVVIGSTVYIFWGGVQPISPPGTVDITVIDPDGETVAQWTDQAPSQSGVNSFVPSETGTYMAIFEGYPSYHTFSLVVASASIFSAPESSLGSIMALGIGIAAFGAVALVKYKKTRALNIKILS